MKGLMPCLFALIIALPTALAAHRLTVFAFTGCTEVLVATRFSNGRHPVQGQVRLVDSTGAELTSGALASDGTSRFALDQFEHGNGFRVLVNTGSHEGFWTVTPEDLAQGCNSLTGLDKEAG